MTVRGIDNQKIHVGLNQGLSAAHAIFTYAGCCARQKTALHILGCIRIELRLFHVFYGDKTNTILVLINHQKLFDTVLVQ